MFGQLFAMDNFRKKICVLLFENHQNLTAESLHLHFIYNHKKTLLIKLKLNYMYMYSTFDVNKVLEFRVGNYW